MSEGITHTAIVDDCARLLVHAPGICEAFRRALAAHPDLARLGGITRHGDHHTPSLLAAYRDRWPPADPKDPLAQKLAFVLGWLSHRAADRQMKPVFRALDGACTKSPRDCSVYHDACVLREVYGGGGPFASAGSPEGSASLPGAGGGDVAAVEGLFKAMWQRMLLEMHTFVPDDEDVETWLGRVIETHQELYVDLARYARAFASPDADLWQRFVAGPNFYDRRDPLLVRARSLSAGPPAGTLDLEDALEAARGQSLYARALRRAFLYCRSASEFFERKIGDGELKARLDIGKPELSG